jgi:putative YhbY family RNA-binding protein
MNPLDPTERRALRAKAHHLEPVVTIGHHGLTPPVLHEIDVALLAHDLVKVRVLGGDRDAREAMLAQVCATLDCAPVQHLGKVLVLWRPNPERRKKAPMAA